MLVVRTVTRLVHSPLWAAVLLWTYCNDGPSLWPSALLKNEYRHAPWDLPQESVPGPPWIMGQRSPQSQSLVLKENKILICVSNKTRPSRLLSYRSVTVTIVKDTNNQFWDLMIIKLCCSRLYHSRSTSLRSHSLYISLYKVLVNTSGRSWEFPA